jgi:hypothetical protein
MNIPGKRVATPIGFALLVAVVYGRALGYPFLDWDDKGYILRNPLVQHPLAFGWKYLLATPVMGYPQPLTILTHHFDFIIGGGMIWPFHLGNLVLHLACVLLVLHLLLSYQLSRPAALIGAALFAVHPIVVEPVCWATGRKDLLAASLVLAGFAAYRQEGWRAPVRVGVALACEVLSFGAKPIGVVLPAVLIADAIVFRRRAGHWQWPALGAMAAVALVAIVVSYRSQVRVNALLVDQTAGHRVAFTMQHLALQVRNFVWPARLAPKYLDGLPLPLRSGFGVAGIIVSLAFAVAAAALARVGARRALFALLWVAFTFAPSSGIVPLGRGAADTYFYLPSAGAALLIAMAVERVPLKPVLLHSLAAGVVAVFAFAAHVQTGVWQSSSALWRVLTEVYPESRMAWWAYADALVGEHRSREAIAVYETALTRFPYPPDKPDVLLSLARGCSWLGDVACAAHWYGETLRYFPTEVLASDFSGGHVPPPVIQQLAGDPVVGAKAQQLAKRVQPR